MKKWIKGLVVFLAFMWVCTIISKSIYVSKLPQVQVENPTKKYIEHVVETDGMVIAGEKQAINTLAGLRVSEIKVQEGDYVEEGNLLFLIDLEDLTQIIAKKESELRKLQYQLSDTQFNQILESQKKEIARLWAYEDYEIADEETAIAVTRAQEVLNEAQNNLQKHIGTTVPKTSDEERQNAWNRYNEWKSKLYQAQDNKIEKERELSALQNKLIDVDNLSDEELEEIESEVESLEKELLVIADELITLERDRVAMPDFSSEESEYDVWQEKRSNLEDSVHSAKQGVEDAKRNRNNALREKLRATATAEVLSPLDSTADMQKIEIADMEKELAALYEIREQKGEIKTSKAGYISDIQITVGNRTSDTAAILLADETQLNQFKFSITKEEGKYLKLEDEVEITFKDTNLEASVDYMKENSVGGYDVICKLVEAAKKPGISGTARKVEQGKVHYVTVPSEAVKEESKSYFVYVLKEKKGILGKEYYAEKIKVEIEDQNERLVALKEGTISSEMQVIISCSKEIKQGDSVRME